MKEKLSFQDNIMKYRATWFRIALGIVTQVSDAEEIVCESILKAYEKRETLRKASSFKSWMTSIVLHTAYDYVRKNHDIGCAADEIPETDVSPSAEQEVLEQESRNYIWNQVQKLEDPFRVVIILYYYEEFSTKEISEMLGISRGTVKSRLARGRGKLSELLPATHIF